AEKSHKNWFWCGRVSDGQEKEFNKELNLAVGLHYIELWADRMPEMKSIKFSLNGSEPVKRIPTVDNPEWTGDFNDDLEDILLARLILGEASSQPYEAKLWVGWSVINRTQAKSWWPNTIHGVILQEGQFDPFKLNDFNFHKIINPLGFEKIGEADKKSWYECYKIANDIILRKTENLTEATHFHGIGVSRSQFEKNIVPNGRFLKKIGDTYFYWSPN
ncbi:MAG: cell wall hydrolase, partial [Candidatus Portnoybacteria bacterium]|nr:cell wall hydrolase [Candidatus Portnoybacteria bacterium]